MIDFRLNFARNSPVADTANLVSAARFPLLPRCLKDLPMSNPFASPDFQQTTSMTRSVTKLKRVGVISAGIMMGAGGAMMGLLVGGVFFLISLAGVGAAAGGAGGNGPDPTAAFIGMGVGAIFIVPILYGIGGFIFGVIYAIIYNFLAGMTGGLEVEFSDY